MFFLLMLMLGPPVGLMLVCGLVYVLSTDKGRRSVVLATRSLWLHKLRAFLSVMGIIIGTGAVISLMAFGEGSMQDALEDIKRMGATNVIIRSVKPPEGGVGTSTRTRVAKYGITKSDYARIGVMQRSGTITRMVPMRVFNIEARRLGQMYSSRVVGTTPEYADVNQLTLAAGRFLVPDDAVRMRNVCVLGSAVADNLFPFTDPLGDTIRCGSNFYRVVGVLRERMPTGGTGGSQAAEDYNKDVYIPLETVNVRFGDIIVSRASGAFTREQVELSQITLTVSDMEKVRPTGEVIRGILGAHLKADWAVTVPLDRLEEAERAKERYQWLLLMIASISLVVGGIGIMNIMLATVTERTREIGIRRALGAKRVDIILQFLIEAVVQTTLGGLLGTLVGLTIVLIMVPGAAWLFSINLPAKVHVMSIFLALGVAITVGVVFGLYPAFRASRLDPIEALRHE
jgi:putative ABC transport system permease protein